MKIVLKNSVKSVELVDLRYGTVVTNISSNPECVYIKVNKNRCGSGVSINHTPGFCVLVNLKTGALRELSKNTLAEVLDGTLDIEPASCINDYLRN